MPIPAWSISQVFEEQRQPRIIRIGVRYTIHGACGHVWLKISFQLNPKIQLYYVLRRETNR